MTATADTGYDLIVFDPATLHLFRTGGNAVRLTLDETPIGPSRSYIRVQIARAFPLSDLDQYIGLRDGADKDIGLLESLHGLEEPSRQIVIEELERRYLLPVIEHVRHVKEEYGTYTWDVETDKGARTFVITRLKDSVQELEPTRVLLTDVDGLRYEIPDLRLLDEKSLSILQRVL